MSALLKAGRARTNHTPNSNKRRKRFETDEERERHLTEDFSENTEIESETDEKGEQKITKDGELLGGRRYKVPAFQLLTRGNAWFMLAMEPAKLLGFRDSYLFFLRNPQLKRIYASDEERDYLIENGMLQTNFRNRQIALVSARSIFKLFGFRMIKGGKRRLDDYKESDMDGIENGLSEEDETSETSYEIFSKRGTFFTSSGARVHNFVNDTNWMYQSALSVNEFNMQLKKSRREKPRFYDTHTNIEQVSRATQPSYIKVEKVATSVPIYGLDERESAVDPEINFEYEPPPIFDTLSDEVIEVLPSEIRDIVISSIKKEESKALNEDERYPLSLMEGQFQSMYPLHRTRFNKALPIIPKASQQYFNSLMHPTEQIGTNTIQHQQHYPSHQLYMQYQQHYQQEQQLTPRNQEYNYQIEHMQSSSQVDPGGQYNQNTFIKPNRQFTCGQITVTTGQPCRRGVSYEGEKCMFHKGMTPPPDRPNYIPPVSAPRLDGLSVQPHMPLAASYDPNTCVLCRNPSVDETVMNSIGNPCTADLMVNCSKCSLKYHPICLNLTTPKLLTALESYPWQCNDCKVCVVCRDSGDEASLLICDDCDRGWHMLCCDPKVDQVPQGSWSCPLCARCHSCERKATSLSDTFEKFHHATAPPYSSDIKYPIYLTTYCKKCHENFTADRFCPLCLKTYSGEGDENEGDDDNDMVCCDHCDRWIHCGCDYILTQERYQELVEDAEAKYQCPLCEERISPLNKNDSAQIAALAGRSQPAATPVAEIPGRRHIRGIVEYKGKRVAVPPVSGWGTGDGKL